MTSPAIARRAVGDGRPANAAYREHVLYRCQGLKDIDCQTCFDLYRDASAESWRRSEELRAEHALAALEGGA